MNLDGPVSPNPAHQRDRAVANLPTGEGATGPVMPDVRTPTGSN
jgi:hypothetical protein